MLITPYMIKDTRKSGSKPGEYSGICPVCGERTFCYNVISGMYICFRASCNIKGKFNNLGSDLEEESLSSRKSLSDLKGLVDGLFTNKESVHQVDLDKISDPLDETTYQKYVFAYNYIKRRKFTDEDILRYRLRVGKSYYDKKLEERINRWKGRVIFPFYENDIPIYAIGRSYTDSKPKYLNTDGEKSVIVYNIDKIRNRTCIICEGLISSIFAEKYSGISAVCLLGCSISEDQFQKIRSSVDTVYCSLDGGVNQDSICRRFFLSGCNTYRVDLPVIENEDGSKKGLDPDEVGPEYKRYIENAKRVSII